MERKNLLGSTALGGGQRAVPASQQRQPVDQNKPATNEQPQPEVKPYHGKKALLEELSKAASQLNTAQYLATVKGKYSTAVFEALNQNEIDGAKFFEPQDRLVWWKFCSTAGVNGESIRKSTGNDILLMAEAGLLTEYIAEFRPDPSKAGAFGHTPSVSQKDWLAIEANGIKDGTATAITRWLGTYNGDTLDKWMMADYQKLLLGLLALTPVDQLDELFDFFDAKGVTPREAHLVFQQKDKRGRKQPVPFIWKYIDPAKVIRMAERYSDISVPSICLSYHEGDKTVCEQWSNNNYDIHGLFDWMRDSSCLFSAVQVGFKSNERGLAKAFLTTGKTDLYFALPLLDAADHQAFAGEIIQLVQERKIGPEELEKIPVAQWAAISKKKGVSAQAPLQLAYAVSPARSLISSLRNARRPIGMSLT